MLGSGIIELDTLEGRYPVAYSSANSSWTDNTGEVEGMGGMLEGTGVGMDGAQTSELGGKVT